MEGRGYKKNIKKKLHTSIVRNTVFINTTIHFSELQEEKKITGIQKYINTNYRNTEIQITEILKNTKGSRPCAYLR